MKIENRIKDDGLGEMENLLSRIKTLKILNLEGIIFIDHQIMKYQVEQYRQLENPIHQLIFYPTFQVCVILFKNELFDVFFLYN